MEMHLSNLKKMNELLNQFDLINSFRKIHQHVFFNIM